MIFSLFGHVIGWFIIVACLFPFLNFWLYVQGGEKAHWYWGRNWFNRYFWTRLIVASILADLVLIFGLEKISILAGCGLVIEGILAFLAWIKLSKENSISASRLKGVFIIGGSAQLALVLLLVAVGEIYT